MSSNSVGILIILGIIIIAFATGGDIFRGSNTINTQITSGRVTGADSEQYTRNNAVNDAQVDPNVSPYKNKIRLSYINAPGTFYEYFNLTTNLRDDEFIILTGWKLRSTVTGNEITIGGGANVPFEGLMDQHAVILRDYANIYVIPRKSPIGTSFRVNKCMGYFNQKINFTPGFSAFCPAVIDHAPPLSREINDDCLDYIERLPSCFKPREKDIPDNLSRSCKNFLETKVDYPNCVVNNITDKDFYKNEWHIYTGNTGIMTREKRENIELIDNFGRVVDTYNY